MLELICFFLGAMVAAYCKFGTELGWSNITLTLVWAGSAIAFWVLLKLLPKSLELIGDILEGIF